MQRTFTVHRSPFTMREPFSVIRYQQLMANGKSAENGKRPMVNGAGGA